MHFFLQFLCFKLSSWMVEYTENLQKTEPLRMHNNVAGRPWDGPSGPHSLYVGLVYSPPFDYGQDLWLSPNQKTIAKVQGITSMITTHRIVTSILLPYSPHIWLGCSKFSHWEGTFGKKLRASSTDNHLETLDLIPTA